MSKLIVYYKTFDDFIQKIDEFDIAIMTKNCNEAMEFDSMKDVKLTLMRVGWVHDFNTDIIEIGEKDEFMIRGIIE